MKWELERHDWNEFGENGMRLPEWIELLVKTEDRDRVNRLVSLIGAAVVPSNGALKVGASAVAACLVQGLLSATQSSRVELLYLLFEFAGGAVHVSESELVRDVRREVEHGLPIYAEIAETGTREERRQCIDLLSLCARFNESCLVRATSIMRRIAELGDIEAASVATEFADLASSGFAVMHLTLP